MELTRPGYAVIYVILLCALAQGGSEGKEEENYRDGGALSSPSSLHNHIHRKQAENEWKHCRKELTEKNNDVNDFDLHPPERSSDMSSILSIEKNIHKTTKSLSPHMKKKVLDCTRKSTTPPAPVSKEKAGSRHLLTKHSRSTLGLESGHHRRSIAESPHDQMSPASPSHEPTPTSSPTSPSHEPTPASSPASPSHEPTPASSPASPTPVPTAIDLLPLPLNMFVPFSPPPPPHIPRPPSNLYQPITNAPVPSPPSNDDKRQKTIILAATLSGIIILIGLALCCREARRSNRVDKDDRPFLILTSSDYSGGSQKVVRLGDADKEEPGINNGKNPSNARNWSMKAGDNNHASVVETTTSDGTGQVPGTPPGKPAPPPPGPPPPPPPRPPAAARPPPPPRAGHPPPAPPKPVAGKNQLSSLGPLKQGGSSEGDAAKPKLKPFFWDKVSANPDQSMVWHEINAGSFVFNEEKMQSLFCCTNQNKNERKKDSPSIDTSVQYIQIIDPRKAQNLTILLRALNVTTDEVIDALKEGNEIPVELIHTLLKMAPTAEEELKLRLFSGELSQLGPAERFLKVLVDIPFAFKRLESLMFMLILREEATTVKESFATLEVACSKLRKSRLFLKLLEAVLKTGNRMNDGTYRGGAQAFRLDTLLKLSDVKGTDGKTTLLHFVVQEIIRSEGIRAVRTERASRSVVSSVGSTIDQDLDDDYNSNSVESAEHYRSLGLEVVSGLSTELEDVKKAALIDGDALSGAVSKLGHSLVKTQEFLDTDLANLEEDECSEFKRCTERFLGHAREEVTWMVEEEKRIMALVKSTADYFHGNAGKDEGLRLFLIVRDFLIILDKVCKEVRDTTLKAAKAASNNHKKEGPSSMPSSPDTRQQSSPLAPPSDLHRRLFPAIAGRRVDDSSSSDDDDGDEEKKDFSP